MPRGEHAPVLHDLAMAAAYSGGLVILAPGVTISDVDSTTLVSASVHISAGTFAADGDVLAVGAGGLAGTSILANYNAATETLTLSGTDTLAHYQQALEQVTFQSTSADPPMPASTRPGRGLQLNDGSATDNLSSIQTTTLHLQGPPPISAPTPKPPANDFDGWPRRHPVAERRWFSCGLADQRQPASSRGRTSLPVREPTWATRSARAISRRR